ncbi:MAG: SCP2 sterol-binding domain-containing protein [Actinobacteria bacterium]|nr:SCP2 sterol-binding domain-containing protein [Actinomycetota bacterium]
MTKFTNEADAKKYLGGIFEQAMADDALAAELATDIVLRISYTDPDWTLTVDMGNRKVYFDACELAPAVEMFMTSDNGNKFWLGKLNLAAAMAKGQVRAKGSFPKILKLVPASRKLVPRYEAMVRDSGRDDLLAV